MSGSEGYSYNRFDMFEKALLEEKGCKKCDEKPCECDKEEKKDKKSKKGGGARPDYLDLDKDGDKEEDMKDAADSAEGMSEEVVAEGVPALAAKMLGASLKSGAMGVAKRGAKSGSSEEGKAKSGCSSEYESKDEVKEDYYAEQSAQDYVNKGGSAQHMGRDIGTSSSSTSASSAVKKGGQVQHMGRDLPKTGGGSSTPGPNAKGKYGNAVTDSSGKRIKTSSGSNSAVNPGPKITAELKQYAEGIDFKGAKRIDDARAKAQAEKDKKNPSGKDRRLALGKFRPGASAEERAEGGRDSMREKGTSPKKDGKKMFEEIQAAGLFSAEELEHISEALLGKN